MTKSELRRVRLLHWLQVAQALDWRAQASWWKTTFPRVFSHDGMDAFGVGRVDTASDSRYQSQPSYSPEPSTGNRWRVSRPQALVGELPRAGFISKAPLAEDRPPAGNANTPQWARQLKSSNSFRRAQLSPLLQVLHGVGGLRNTIPFSLRDSWISVTAVLHVDGQGPEKPRRLCKRDKVRTPEALITFATPRGYCALYGEIGWPFGAPQVSRHC